MKVGIITFHFVHNCGAMLQCLALQETLMRMGCKVCIINYQPWYHKNRYASLKNPFYYSRKAFRKRGTNDHLFKRTVRGGVGFVKTIYSWKWYPNARKRSRLFDDFETLYLHETRLYRTLEQLQKDPPHCDAYISGSDQVWNAKLTENRIDPAYLLDFGEAHVRRITYAVGCGASYLESNIIELKEGLKHFRAISLRETDKKNLIEHLTNNEVFMHIDIDPALLLEAVDYEPYITADTLCVEPFIFTYAMPDKTQKIVYQAAREFSKQIGLKLIDASGNPQNANRQIEDNRICGPAEFLWYMKHAAYIVTNSFHGTAFSVIFRKQFAAVPHSVTGFRVTELLEKLGLKQRWTNEASDALEILQTPCLFQEAEIKLAQLRDCSQNYLRTYVLGE